MRKLSTVTTLLLLAAACNSRMQATQNGQMSPAANVPVGFIIYTDVKHGFTFDYPEGVVIRDQGKDVFGDEESLVKANGLRASLEFLSEGKNLVSVKYTDNAAIEQHNESCTTTTGLCEILPTCQMALHDEPRYEYVAEAGVWEKIGELTASNRCITMGVLLSFDQSTIMPNVHLSDDTLKQLVGIDKVPASDLKAISIFNAMFSSLKLN